jgi:phosphoribosylglycinamide formyltransferase-1
VSNPAERLPIAVLISGRGSNLRALIERSRDPRSAYRVAEVFCDQPDAPGLELARAAQIPTRTLLARTYADRIAYDQALAAAIDANAPTLIVLAGFMRILSAPFVQRFEGRLLNIHPSLLPKYPGLHTHRRALEAHDLEHGATVHFVTAELDGGPRIVQGSVAIQADDDESRLAARVQVQEHKIYPLAVGWYCEGRLRQQDGAAWLDGRRLREPVRLTDFEQD